MLIKTAAGIRSLTSVYNNSEPGHVHFAIKNNKRGVSKSLVDLELGDEGETADAIPYIGVASPSAKYCQVYSIGAGNGIVHLCGVT
jgi:hypothetical protein